MILSYDSPPVPSKGWNKPGGYDPEHRGGQHGTSSHLRNLCDWKSYTASRCISVHTGVISRMRGTFIREGGREKIGNNQRGPRFVGDWEPIAVG